MLVEAQYTADGFNVQKKCPHRIVSKPRANGSIDCSLCGSRKFPGKKWEYLTPEWFRYFNGGPKPTTEGVVKPDANGDITVSIECEACGHMASLDNKTEDYYYCAHCKKPLDEFGKAMNAAVAVGHVEPITPMKD